jgi:hypothetical protein
VRWQVPVRRLAPAGRGAYSAPIRDEDGGQEPDHDLRKLAKEPRARLVKGRTGGGWLMINDRDLLVDKFIDLERLGRQTGVLREYERLEG